jgi:hypothetical protein
MDKKRTYHPQYSRYPKTIAYAETNSAGQVKRIVRYANQEYTLLTDEERKKLKRSQFAFGSLYPYVFDGLTYIATHHKELLKEVDDLYYKLELPIDELCLASLSRYQKYNREYFIHELLRQGRTSSKEEEKHLRCIPLGDGKQVSIQPLIIGLVGKTQETISPTDLKKLMNLTTYSEHTQVINTVRLYVLKILIDPIFDGSDGGWFFCPTALQAKIVSMLKTQPPMKDLMDKFNPYYYGDLNALKLRKYYLLINSIDGSKESHYIEVDAIDLWEHVSPGEIIRNSGYANIRDWEVKRQILQKANRFFTDMEAETMMAGAKAFPAENPRDRLKGVFYDPKTKKYRIYFKRSQEYLRLKEKRKVFAEKS